MYHCVWISSPNGCLSQRDIDREIRNMERQERELIADIKKASKQGNEVSHLGRVWVALSRPLLVIITIILRHLPRPLMLSCRVILQKVMRTLATNLVNLRAQRDKLIGMKANVTAAGYRTTVGMVFEQLLCRLAQECDRSA
jgi:hypothetical protein